MRAVNDDDMVGTNRMNIILMRYESLCYVPESSSYLYEDGKFSPNDNPESR